MNDEREKPLECYNFSGIRELLKKYKALAAKRQNDRKNNLSNHRNKISKASNHAQDDDISKGTHSKRQDAKNHINGMKKVRQNENGVKIELNNINRQGDKHKDYQLRNRLLKAIIALVDPSKKNKVSSKVSASDSPAANHKKSPLRTQSLDSDYLTESSRSPSMKKSRSEECLTTEDDISSRAPSMCRTNSKRSSVLGGFEERSNNESFKSNGRTKSKTGSQVIMFSCSSGPLKPPAIEQKLECTLEELCHGCVKYIKVSRDVFTCTGQRTKQEEVLTVNIEPGWSSGTKITFQGVTKEDINAGEFPADVIFTIIEKHHPLFRRVEDDLELEIEIPLADALTGCPLTIPLLGNEKMGMELDQVVYPGYEVTIVGQGMPKANQKDPEDRGDLKIKFLVNFPTELTDDQREEVSRILGG